MQPRNPTFPAHLDWIACQLTMPNDDSWVARKQLTLDSCVTWQKKLSIDRFLTYSQLFNTADIRQMTAVVTGDSCLARKVSQLSLANVEDVTSEQKGIFSNLFSYGVLNIETAGEQTNFYFNYCPNPHRVAKIILHAKDDFMIATGQTGSTRNRLHNSRSSDHSHY